MADTASRTSAAGFVVALVLLLQGCGQTGALYLPEPQATEAVTRPATTPPAGDNPSSPETVDSPSTPASPAPEVTAPEVTAPEPGKEATKDKTKKDGASPPR